MAEEHRPVGPSDLFRTAPFENLRVGMFLRRPNRFLVECKLRGRSVTAYLPNPGRLRELLLPGRKVWLAGKKPVPGRRTALTAVAVEKGGAPVFLHTHFTNEAAHRLLADGLIPGLEGYAVKKREVTVGNSRIDFLLERGKRELLLEVKSCTLYGREIAMFPDAVTERGKRHLLELASLRGGRRGGAVLFVVHWPGARHFLPDYHTDLSFAKTLQEVKNTILVKAVAVGWNSNLTLSPAVREVGIPWRLVEREAHDRGSYILVLRLPRRRRIEIGRLGTVSFPKGYYLYAGSGSKNLSPRINRHRRRRKKLHWHIDYLRETAEFHDVLPVLSPDRLECRLSASLGTLADWTVPHFGSSDCSCATHLFGMGKDPLLEPAFIDLLTCFRMDRLTDDPLTSRLFPQAGEYKRRSRRCMGIT